MLTCGPQSGRTSAPIIPRRVQTIREQSERTVHNLLPFPWKRIFPNLSAQTWGFFQYAGEDRPVRRSASIFPVSRRQPVELLVADEHCSACHNARNQSAHTRKQHRVYHKFDHCAFLYRLPHCRYPNSTGWQKSVGRMGASAEVLDFFRAWHSRNIQQTRTRRSNGSLVGGNECPTVGQLGQQ